MKLSPLYLLLLPTLSFASPTQTYHVEVLDSFNQIVRTMDFLYDQNNNSLVTIFPNLIKNSNTVITQENIHKALNSNNTVLIKNKSKSSNEIGLKTLNSSQDFSSISYVDLCLKNENKIEYSYKQIEKKNSDFVVKVTNLENINAPHSNGSEEPMLDFTFTIPYLKSTNIGDCNIDIPINQSFKLKSALPFFYYEQKYSILDNKGQILPTEHFYTVKIQSRKLKL